MKNVIGQALPVCGMSPGGNVIRAGTDVVWGKNQCTHGLAGFASVQFVTSKLKGEQSEQMQQECQAFSSALHTHNIMLLLSKHRKPVQYPAEADASLVSRNSHTPSLTHSLGNKEIAMPSAPHHKGPIYQAQQQWTDLGLLW